MTEANTRQRPENNEAQITMEAAWDASFYAHSKRSRWGDDNQSGMLSHQAHSRMRAFREVAGLFCSRWD